MNTVHIFYNGDDYFAPEPQDDKWSNYEHANNPRLFLACAASWQKHGWNVVRVRTDNLQNGFDFQGVLKRDLARYPEMHWNLWHKLRLLAPCLCVNMNVFNQGFVPDMPEFIEAREDAVENGEGLSLHVNGWCASAMYVTRKFIDVVNHQIQCVDGGFVKPPKCVLFTDDEVIRQNLERCFRTLPLCTFPFIRSDWQNSPLLHFSRSIIRRSMDTIQSL